jgi:hypothetical protein
MQPIGEVALRRDEPRGRMQASAEDGCGARRRGDAGIAGPSGKFTLA